MIVGGLKGRKFTSWKAIYQTTFFSLSEYKWSQKFHLFFHETRRYYMNEEVPDPEAFRHRVSSSDDSAFWTQLGNQLALRMADEK
jgi:hypothetical protein